jgi:hypothetical protein
VAKGTIYHVELRTEPESDFGIILAFSDDQAHDTYEVATTDANGFHRASLLIKDDVPTGPAQLLVSVGRNGRGRVEKRPFTVVGADERCS